MKPELKIVVDGAAHFLNWELEYFMEHFELLQMPEKEVILLAFGPDVLETSLSLPASFRIAVLFPGFRCNPYHNLEYRRRALDIIDSYYDLVFVNP